MRSPKPTDDTTSAPAPSASGQPAVAGVVARPMALALLILVIAVWGANWPIMKLTLASIPPLTFAVARLALGSLCLLAVLLALGRLRLPGRDDLPVVVTVGLLQLAGYLAFIHLGLVHVAAGRSAILGYTTMIWVAPLAAAFLGERLTRRKSAGLASGLGGVLALFNPVEFDWSDGNLLLGNGFLLAGALCWAISIVHVRAHRFRLTPLQLAPWQMAVGLVPLVAVAAYGEDPSAIDWSPGLAAALIYNGALATGFALWAWLSLNRALSAITTSMGSLGVPVVGLVTSALWLGEPISATTAAGLLLIVAGLALIASETEG
ncbi:MAG: DMT family transporter [Alphaproteobacteria bacterium]|nr:DMT family transporter [Alphaproteobacteria bacterium]